MGRTLAQCRYCPGAGVPCLQLVLSRSESLGTPSSRAVRLMAFRHFVLLPGGPASGPSPCFHPFFLRNPPLEVCEGSQQWHWAYLRPVRVVQPFHPAGVWLPRRDLSPLVRLLVALNPFVSQAPSDLNDELGLARSSAAMCFLGWSAYCWSGPGSSEAIRLMAAWASVKIVTRSGIVCLLEANSSALARAAHSAS